MKTEYKNLWVDALRSGEYAQAQRRLTLVDENGNKSHCCLGLLCDLVKDKIELEVSEQAGSIAYDEATAVLPPSVADQLGLKTYAGVPDYKFFIDPSRGREDGAPNPSVHGEYKSEWISSEVASLHLASLNDSGLTFSQIADIIEWAEPED